MPMTRNRWPDLAWAIAIAGLATVSMLLHPLNSDEGNVLNGAWNIINGRVPYVDTFEFVAPGSHYAVYFVWSLLGPSYWSARLLAVLLAASAAGAIILIARRLEPRSSPQLLSVLYFSVLAVSPFPLINYSVFCMVATLWAVYFAMRAMEDGRWRDVLASGVITGLGVLALQHKGLVAMAVIAAAFLLPQGGLPLQLRLRRALIYLSAAILPLGLFLRWPVDTLAYSLLWFPMGRYTNISLVSLDLWAALALFALLTFLVIWQRHRTSGLYLLAGLQFALFLSSMQLADQYHLLIAVAPMVAAIPVAHHCLRASGSVAGATYHAIVIVVFGSYVLLLGYAMLFWGRAPYEQARNEMARFVRERCGSSEFLHAGPFLPHIYFETRKLSATRYGNLIESFHTEAQFEEAAQELEQRRPPCAIVDHKIVEKYGYSSENPVEALLEWRYQEVGKFESMHFLVLRDER